LIFNIFAKILPNILYIRLHHVSAVVALFLWVWFRFVEVRFFSKEIGLEERLRNNLFCIDGRKTLAQSIAPPVPYMRCVYRDSRCDIQPWARAAHLYSVYIHQMNRMNSRNDIDHDDSTMDIVVVIIIINIIYSPGSIDPRG